MYVGNVKNLLESVFEVLPREPAMPPKMWYATPIGLGSESIGKDEDSFCWLADDSIEQVTGAEVVYVDRTGGQAQPFWATSTPRVPVTSAKFADSESTHRLVKLSIDRFSSWSRLQLRWQQDHPHRPSTYSPPHSPARLRTQPLLPLRPSALPTSTPDCLPTKRPIRLTLPNTTISSPAPHTAASLSTARPN